MLKKYFLILPLLFITTTIAADSKEEFKKYLNEAAQEVKNTDDPSEKREILDNLFHKLLEAADYAESWPFISEEEKKGIAVLKEMTEEKHNELNGYNGFNKVADADLNRFADYTVQELEQAAEYVTISVLTLVLIIIVVAILL
ncbi:MAG: hypothetical protein R6W90_03875 [Ignavibacteriaceae bacterium]